MGKYVLMLIISGALLVYIIVNNIWYVIILYIYLILLRNINLVYKVAMHKSW